MTAKEMMAKMLDELMGTGRDGEVQEDSVKFTDPEVCKSYLMGLCPYELFRNTKLDLGSCNKIHSPALKADFEIASKKRNYKFNLSQLDHLSSFIKDCDRKVELNRHRLEDTQDDKDMGPEATAVHELNEQIGKKLAEIEELGAEGKVDESMALMREMDGLKQDKRKAEDIYRSAIPASANQQQKLRVCEVCAAYLSLYDNDRRLADHFGGKLHMGFIKIRNRCTELQEEVAKEQEERRNEQEKQRKRYAEENRSRGSDYSRDSRDRRRSNSRERRDSRDRHRSSRDDRDYRRDRDSKHRSRDSRSSRRSRSRSR